MGANYVKYKARVLQMLSSGGGNRRLIAFSVDMPSLSTIGIKSITVDGTPITVVVGNESSITTLIELLQIARMAVSIPIQSNIDILSIALGAQHVVSEPIHADLAVDVSSVAPASQYVQIETISNAFDFLIGMTSPDSISTKVDAMPTVSDLETQLRLCGYNELSVVMENESIISFSLRDDIPLDIVGEYNGAMQATGNFNIDATKEASMEASGTLVADVTITTDTEWVQIKSDTVYYLLTTSDIVIDESKSIESSENYLSIIAVTIGLITGAVLSDYDSDTLAEMDTYTLEELKYKITHN